MGDVPLVCVEKRCGRCSMHGRILALPNGMLYCDECKSVQVKHAPGGAVLAYGLSPGRTRDLDPARERDWSWSIER